ncbi:MAG: hypothetical protein H7Y27_02865 [Gemmatimonadaceae bacterium]|nr:hypothetical protein [Chitinophagaceae bacterium]
MQLKADFSHLCTMYTHIWNKYLPIVRILLKKSANGAQVLDLNRVDFERAGTGRKAGYKFTIEFNNGRVANVISGSPLALDLAAAMQEDAVVKGLIVAQNYEVSLNTKFQLHIRNVSPKAEAPKAESEDVASEAN